MAVDEALLDSLLAGRGRPTLRLYGWRPPAVSIGRFQSLAPEQTLSSKPSANPSSASTLQKGCERLGLPLVRRLTGGRAVLHDQEVTYCVVLPHLGQGIVESYRSLSDGLRRGLTRLGINSQMGQVSSRERAPSPDCFAAAARADLIASAGARTFKLAGSAQCRRREALLQHGSLPLAWDRERYAALFGQTPDASGAGSLSDFLGRTPTWEEAAGAMIEGFRDLWGPEAEAGTLSPAEHDAAASLCPAYSAISDEGGGNGLFRRK